MAIFSYEARNITGTVVKGKIEAKDDTDAKVKLRAKQLVPIKVAPFGASTVAKDSNLALFLAAKITPKELKIFTRQFATLINAGIPIADALRILSEGTGISPLLKECLIKIRGSIDSGRRLSESMAMHPKVFDKLYCNMIQAGEEAGILDTILNRLSVYIEKNEKIKSQVKGALVMPSAILGVSVLVVGGIIVFIIPKFQEIYAGSGTQLPALTQMLIDLSNVIRSKWHIVIISLIGGISGIFYYFSTPEGKINFDKMLIGAPLFGDLVQKSSIARMTRTLSTLLSSGVGLIEAIEIASKTAGNYVIEKALADCKEAVMAGKPFQQPLSRQKVIPNMVSQMVGIGEQSGSVDIMLAKIADFYEEEVENAVKAMTSLIEPIMMVGLGGVIAVVMIAMYLPVFSIGDTIK